MPKHQVWTATIPHVAWESPPQLNAGVRRPPSFVTNRVLMPHIPAPTPAKPPPESDSAGRQAVVRAAIEKGVGLALFAGLAYVGFTGGESFAAVLAATFAAAALILLAAPVAAAVRARRKRPNGSPWWSAWAVPGGGWTLAGFGLSAAAFAGGAVIAAAYALADASTPAGWIRPLTWTSVSALGLGVACSHRGWQRSSAAAEPATPDVPAAPQAIPAPNPMQDLAQERGTRSDKAVRVRSDRDAAGA